MDEKRALPGQASLRYLKVEAKRRRASGEFATLHDAQLALAREHGFPGWTALRDAVAAAASGNEGHALTQLRWIIARFRDAGAPGWTAPGAEELREHFTPEYLAAVTPETVVARATELAFAMREELTVLNSTPFTALVKMGGHLVTAATETRPPYRFSGVQPRPLGERVSDPLAAGPPTAAAGPVPGPAAALAAAAAAQLGLTGLALAGASAPGQAWTTVTGWASLERREALSPGHAFPAGHVTGAVTAAAVLCLAAAGRLRLDDQANAYRTAVRLADDAVTVRDLLAHTGGVTDPVAAGVSAGPTLAAVTGPVIACTGKRGAFGYAQAGYAMLGEIIAERTGLSYPEAVSRLVLRPLGMRESWFPGGRPDEPAAARPVVTGYDVTPDGAFTALDGEASVFPPATGLWTTTADLVRFGLGWRSLLPRPLAAQALRPHAVQPGGIPAGLGWGVNAAADLAGVTGGAPGTAACLVVSLDGRHACAALANRQLPMNLIAAQALLLIRANPDAAEHSAAEHGAGPGTASTRSG